MKNSFSNNVAFKGILIVELAQNKTAPAIIYGNSFTNNSAIIDANVLNIRVINNINLLGYSYSSPTDLTCGGVTLNSNSFTNNSGCTQTNGAVFAYCFDSS